MARRKKSDRWDILATLIVEYGDACRADEMKGAGAPEDADVIEAQLVLVRAKIDAHMAKMQREFE